MSKNYNIKKKLQCIYFFDIFYFKFLKIFTIIFLQKTIKSYEDEKNEDPKTTSRYSTTRQLRSEALSKPLFSTTVLSLPIRALIFSQNFPGKWARKSKYPSTSFPSSVWNPSRKMAPKDFHRTVP